MQQLLTVIIGFTHDFAAGCWAATVFAVFWLHRQNLAVELVAALFDLKKQFFYLGLACIGVVLLTGAGRTFTYVPGVYGKNAERKRRLALVIKHLLLGTVFGLGSWWQYTMVFGQ